MSEDKEGKYCTICGGMPPDQVKIKKITIEGKETGIDKLDFILDEVITLNLKNESQIKEELLKRTRIFNYIPTKKVGVYADALWNEYQLRVKNALK